MNGLRKSECPCDFCVTYSDYRNIVSDICSEAAKSVGLEVRAGGFNIERLLQLTKTLEQRRDWLDANEQSAYDETSSPPLAVELIDAKRERERLRKLEESQE